MTVVVKKPTKPAFFNSALDTLFNDFFTTPEVPATALKSRPAINVVETDDNFRLELAAPGLNKEDFAVSVEENLLTLEVDKAAPEAEGEKVIRKGFSYHAFKRSFQLGDAVDTAGIDARYENGVLYVTLPKKEEAKPQPARKIEIA